MKAYRRYSLTHIEWKEGKTFGFENLWLLDLECQLLHELSNSTKEVRHLRQMTATLLREFSLVRNNDPYLMKPL